MINKVLIVNPAPLFGGATTATISVAKMLQKQGIEVVYSDEYDKADNREGLEVYHFPYHGKKFRGHKQAIRHVIEEIEPQCVIWSAQIMIYYYRDIVRMKKMGIRQMSIVHSVSLKQDWRGKLMDSLISRCISVLDAVVYVSLFTLDSWNKFSVLRQSNTLKKVIYNAVELPDVLHKKEDCLRVGFVGRFSEEKQPEIFCALSEIQSINGNVVEYHAYGDGPLFDQCKQMFPKVNFHGSVRDVESIYKNIDILVLTSQFENCPMVVLEAKMRGIPCVAPRVGGIPEVVSDMNDGLLFSDYTTECIINKIDIIINNYREYSANSVINSKKFTYDAIGKEWQSLLASI